MLFKRKNEINDSSSAVGTLAVDIFMSTVIFAFLIFVSISFKSVFSSVSNVFYAFGNFLKNYTLIAVIGIVVVLYIIRVLSRSGSIFRIRRENKEKRSQQNKKYEEYSAREKKYKYNSSKKIPKYLLDDKKHIDWKGGK